MCVWKHVIAIFCTFLYFSKHQHLNSPKFYSPHGTCCDTCYRRYYRLRYFQALCVQKEEFPTISTCHWRDCRISPDLDIPFSWFYNWITGNIGSFHREFTHSIIFSVLFIAVAVAFQFYGNKKWSRIWYVIAAGWFMHVLIDCAFGGFLPFLWPITTVTSCPSLGFASYMSHVDAILLVLWLVHEEVHKKIKDYV